MHIYDKMFLEYGINVAQILLTRENIVDTEQRQNIHNTFTELTKIGVVPIINENDSVATAELKHIENFGDNDTLSAVVARMCEADLLVIFSDIDGLYDADPKTHPDAKLLHQVTELKWPAAPAPRSARAAWRPRSARPSCAWTRTSPCS